MTEWGYLLVATPLKTSRKKTFIWNIVMGLQISSINDDIFNCNWVATRRL